MFLRLESLLLQDGNTTRSDLQMQSLSKFQQLFHRNKNASQAAEREESSLLYDSIYTKYLEQVIHRAESTLVVCQGLGEGGIGVTTFFTLLSQGMRAAVFLDVGRGRRCLHNIVNMLNASEPVLYAKIVGNVV